MTKNYVLDTNVLIHDPNSIFQFEDNFLYIPIYVLEELDKLKSEHGSLRGRNARETCKLLDELRCQGSLSNGIFINDNGSLRVYVPETRKPISVALDHNNMDNAILQCAHEIANKSELRTILVTMDVNLRVRAESLGIQTASYESQSIDPYHVFSGTTNLTVADGDIDILYQDDHLSYEKYQSEELYHNVCLMLQEPCGKTGLGRLTGNYIKPIRLPKEGIVGIQPRNREQQFALDLLLDRSVKIITLTGTAGSGKTLLALAAGLSQVAEGKYSKLIVSRPVIPMGGKDIGYIPGSIDEKMLPWVQPIYDNLELLMMTGGKKKTGMQYEDLFKQDIIRVEPLTYIRGRSLPSQYIIIDESQNLSIHEIKTIITRCGEGSKIVLTGDPDQIDSPYLDKSSCGLNVAVEKLHNNPMVGHVTLSKGERSELANLAAAML
ncbi:MAG: PhoH family protein [Clostridia bacterium]|jgi:PhoH-like ATPase